MDLTYKQKQLLYRHNEYTFDPPPVPTRLWDEDAWIRYIDLHGIWRKSALEKFSQNPLDSPENPAKMPRNP